MLQVARDTLELGPAAAPEESDYWVWAGYRIPDDRSGWHPLVRTLYDFGDLSLRPAAYRADSTSRRKRSRPCGLVFGCLTSTVTRCATGTDCAVPR